MEENSSETHSKCSRVIFWLLWSVLLLIIPFYGLTLIVEVYSVISGNILSYIPPIIGLLVFIAQITVFVISYKQMKQDLPLSKPYLTFVGGSIVIGFILGGWLCHYGAFLEACGLESIICEMQPNSTQSDWLFGKFIDSTYLI